MARRPDPNAPNKREGGTMSLMTKIGRLIDHKGKKEELYAMGRADARAGRSATTYLGCTGDPLNEMRHDAAYYMAGFMDEVADRVFSTDRKPTI